MKTYPDLYLVEDDLKRTALEKAEDGLREAKNYVEFFATNFSEATVNLVRGEKPHIMDILLRALRNIAAWETLLRQLGTKALEHKWDGNPLLHRTVAYIATCTRSDNQFAILLDVVKAILRHVPESITQMNQQNLSAYQLHHQLHQNLLEEERQREEKRQREEERRLDRREEERRLDRHEEENRFDRREKERQLARVRQHEAESQRGESTKPDNSLAKKSSVDFEKHIAPETLGLIRRSSIVSLPKDRPANNPKDIKDVESTSKFGTERSYKIRTRKKKATFSDLKSRVNKTLARFLQLELLRKVDAKDIPILLYHENEGMLTIKDLLFYS
jgi:TolA-binding protein